MGRFRNEFGAVCVPYVRAHGFDIQGNANQWPALALAAGYTVDQIPEVNAAIVTTENSANVITGHVVIQTGEEENGYIPVKEQNYVKGMESEGWLPTYKVVAIIHPKI